MPDDFDLNSVILERVDKRLELLSKIIIGNGEIGMAEDVRTLKAKVKALEVARAEAGMKFWGKIVLISTAVGGIMEIADRLLGG